MGRQFPDADGRSAEFAMKHFSLGHRLPEWIVKPLFGDRRRFGLIPQTDDPSWLEWERVYLTFYEQNQKRSVGALVNDAGYRVMGHIDLQGKTVLEIGPGALSHIRFWRGRPDLYVVADVQKQMLDQSAALLRRAGVRCETQLVERGPASLRRFKGQQFDAVVSFYSLEHLTPLCVFLDGISDALADGGLLIGGIPTEGGLAWGIGRYLTSRRWLKKYTSVDPDKIICWEHPNFADAILEALDRRFKRRVLSFWPLRVPSIDLNLIARFVYGAR
jgi:SAM-dependent methyltransferase